MTGNFVDVKREMLEDVGVIGGLIAVQFVYAGNSMVLSYLLSIGIQSSFLVISSTFATFFVLSPLAFRYERNLWPKRVNLKLLIQLVLIAFAGVTLFQLLLMKGIQLTSPAIATAMPNLAPGLIFIIAWAVGLEKVKLCCKYSQVKIVGTLLCVIGAVTMSIMQSTTGHHITMQISNPKEYSFFDRDKIVGCLYLMAAAFVLSSNVVLQAMVLSEIPAPISLCAVTSIIGVILTGLVEFIQDHTIEIGWQIWGINEILCYSLLAGSIGGACVSFNGWAMKKRGPVLVSMFNPIGTVITALLSAFYRDPVGLGSISGMAIMFIGLYFVLWAKGKEAFPKGDASTLDESGHVYDPEQPLLS